MTPPTKSLDETAGNLLSRINSVIEYHGGRLQYADDIEKEWIKHNWHSNKRWTKYDFEYIICHHNEKSFAEMAEHLNCSIKALKCVLEPLRKQKLVDYKYNVKH